MKCPECGSEYIRKNGHRQHKQNYICVGCGRQFLTEYEPKGYSEEVKRLCLKMYVNGMGVRGISRVPDIAHTTILGVGKGQDELGRDRDISKLKVVNQQPKRMLQHLNRLGIA